MPLDVFADNTLPPILSAFVVGMALFFAGGSAFRFLHAAIRERRLATLVERKSTTLKPGHAVVTGEVRYAQGSPVAMRVRVELSGVERKGSKGGRTFEWKESDRRVDAHAFYVDTPEGETVRVEADSTANFVDDLIATERPSHTREIRVAELSRGERVYVEGTLSRDEDPEREAVVDGYRGASRSGWVIRKSDSPLMISSKGLGEPHRFAARQNLRGAAWCFATVIGFSLASGFFLARTFAGDHEVARITGLRSWLSTGKHRTWHYEVTWSAPSGIGEDDEVDDEDYADLVYGQAIDVLTVPSLPSASSIGSKPCINVLIVMLMAFLAVGLLMGHSAAKRLPWYRAPVRESGSGKLPPSKFLER